ncbi:NAD(P)H-binding protein [Flavobacterium sp. W21_SRS_FM6]|uniref:NAD(P)H-binding protein n=1 Tax=Flavobacterium sp. W21_SRS_FM6 TaxID=3240268 RepID=UPI003F8E46E7
MSDKFHALVLGATGLVGKQLVNQLLVDKRYESVTLLLRKPLAQNLFIDSNKKLQPLVIDFNRLDEYQGYFGAEHIYVCLGTTIKKAGSRANFRRVDFEYVHIAAQLARAQRAASFVWISSVGANAKSRNFYLRVKGELENAIMKMTGLEHASGVRPSLLLGEREEKRFGEWLGARLAKIMAPLFKGKLAKYRPVSAHEVAAQMVRLQRF